MTPRNGGLEDAFLEAAERRAGMHGLGWAQLVRDRLELVGCRHGDRWHTLTPREFIHEIRLESLDLGGWPVLFAQRLLALELDNDCSLPARLKLEEIAAHGVAVERLLRELAGLLEP